MSSPGVWTLSEHERRVLAVWAADCAERVLDLFEAHAPGDDRPRSAINGLRAFAQGQRKIGPLKALSAQSHAAARAVGDPAAVAAARAAGQGGGHGAHGRARDGRCCIRRNRREARHGSASCRRPRIRLATRAGVAVCPAGTWALPDEAARWRNRQSGSRLAGSSPRTSGVSDALGLYLRGTMPRRVSRTDSAGGRRPCAVGWARGEFGELT